MTDEVVARVLESSRYRDVDRALVVRVAGEELRRARGVDDAVKRVKRRLHQAVGAYRGAGPGAGDDRLAAAWSGTWTDGMRDACRSVLATHASTRERLPEVERFYEELWSAIGSAPSSVLDVACGLNPVALPFMALASDAEYLACDTDGRVLDRVDAFLSLVGQPHRTWACDLVTGPPDSTAEVALLLKTVPILDRQDPGAAARLLGGLRTRWVVVSFPERSLGGRSGLRAAYETRMGDLVEALGDRVVAVAELRVARELVYVLKVAQSDA